MRAIVEGVNGKMRHRRAGGDGAKIHRKPSVAVDESIGDGRRALVVIAGSCNRRQNTGPRGARRVVVGKRDIDGAGGADGRGVVGDHEPD